MQCGLVYFSFPFPEKGEDNINANRKENTVVMTENVKGKIHEVPEQNTKELETVGVVATEKKVAKKTKESKEKIKEDERFTEVVNYNYLEASPVKGLQHLYKYFGTALSCPTTVLKDSIEGTVLVSFVVGKEGEIKNIEVVEWIT